MPTVKRRPKTYWFDDVTITIFDVHSAVSAIASGASGFQDHFRFLADANSYRDAFFNPSTIETKCLEVSPLARRLTGIRRTGKIPKIRSKFWYRYLQIRHDNSIDYWKLQLPFVVRPKTQQLTLDLGVKGVVANAAATAYLNALGWSTNVRIRIQGKLKAEKLVELVGNIGSNDRSPWFFNSKRTTLTDIFRNFERHLSEEVYAPDNPPHPLMQYPRRWVIAINSYAGPMNRFENMADCEKQLFYNILNGRKASDSPVQVALRTGHEENFSLIDFGRGILVFPQRDADKMRTNSDGTASAALRPLECHAENTRAFYVAHETMYEFLKLKNERALDGGLFPTLEACVKSTLEQLPQYCWNRITDHFHQHRIPPQPKASMGVSATPSPTPATAPAPSTAPAKSIVLFLASSPIGVKETDLKIECRTIREKIRASEYPRELELKTEWAVRPDDLLQYLNEFRPHVVHFSGCGSATEKLYFHDENDRAKPVSTAALRALFLAVKDNIRLVVLNACYSGPQAKAIAEVIDCAVGMKKAIGNEAAIIFAASFYSALGFGRSVQEAFDQGCVAMQLQSIPEENTPQLLVKNGVDARKVFLVGSSANPA